MSNPENNSVADTRPPAASPAGGALPVLGLIAIIAASLLVLFWEGIQHMVGTWNSPEYNHGYMIPFVALYLLWLRARALDAQTLPGSWFGVILLVLSLFLLLLGELSAVYAIIQYGFVLGMWAVVTAATGARGMKLLWVPLLYLVFMVPLPAFIATRMTAGLQLLSSELGVAVIRAAGLSVFLEGNVIDLGTYKLQVAEACSGMRYLFPLLSFGYLCAVLFQGRWWQRAVLLVAVVPITILMNSFRIGVIGILVNYYGIEQAEGFLHDFEGWVVFMSCVGILFLIIWVFARMERKGFLEIFGLDIPPVSDLTGLVARARPNRPTLVTAAALAVAALASLVVTRPPTLVPERQSLATFPLRIGEWQGREDAVEQVYLDVLQTSDELMANFKRPGDPAPVNLWIAYYDSQVKGVSVHSPQACLPGGGWQIESFGIHTIKDVGPGGEDLQVNRAVISMGDVRQVVYYWFEQRGRRLTSEFMVKWYIFQDGITMNRTDGALVRLITFVPDRTLLSEAEERLEDFLRAADPQLAYHLPGADAPVRAEKAVATR
jgi:exosortase D (VPLPA-CTERM-specific)